MKHTNNNKWILGLVPLIGVLCFSTSQAAVTFTISASGGSVNVVGTGSLNVAGASYLGWDPFSFALIAPQSPGIIVGAESGDFDNYRVDNNGSTLATFGTVGLTDFDISTGDIIGFQDNDGDFDLLVPRNYVSGTSLSGTGSVVGSFASLGLTPGTYVYNYDGPTGSGPSDTITVNVIPEPSSALLMGLACVGYALRRRRNLP